MKIVHPNITAQIDFNKSENYLLIIENPKEYFALTKDLYNQTLGGEGRFVLSQQNETLSFEKNVCLIHDFYSLTSNTKKNINLLNNQVSENFKQGDYIELIAEINQKFIQLNDTLLQNLDLNVEYKDLIEIEDIIKIASYQITETQSLVDNIITFVDFSIKLKHSKLLILVGLQNLMNEQDLYDLVRQIDYMDINLLMVDNIKRFDLPNAKTIIIDNDLCEI